MIVANFNKGTTISQIFGLWQYDYGQVLRIQGLNLPTAIEIHFSYQRTGGEAKTRIGMTKDGVTDVVIPDSMLENQDTDEDYKIYAFVYVTDDSSGQTEYCITMNVQSRPKPEAFDRPEDGEIFKEAIQAVRESADQAAESARQAESIKESVQDMVDTIGSIDEQVKAVKEFAQKAETASNNAALSEKSAKESKEAAETAKTVAVQSAESAKQSEAAVETARQEVAENKTAVEQAVSGFDGKVVEANIAIENAKTRAVKAVEDKGDEVLQSIPPDFETQMESKLNKQQGIEDKGKVLMIGDDGNVVPGEVQSGGGDGIAIINTMSGESPLVIPDSAERVNKGFAIIGNTIQNQDPPPSPEYPQEIKSVGKRNEEKQKYEVDVKVTRKNLINASVFEQGYLRSVDSGQKVSLNTELEKSFTSNMNAESIRGANVSISVKTKNGSGKKYVFADETDTIISGKWDTGLSDYSIFSNIQVPQNACKFYFSVTYDVQENTELQIEVSSKVTAYEPYREPQTLTLTSDRPITKWDKLIEQDGQIGWLYQSKESYIKTFVSFMGKENILGHVYYKIKSDVSMGMRDYGGDMIYCTHMPYYQSGKYPDLCCALDSGYTCVMFGEVTGINSIETANEWLRDKSIKVIHKYVKTEFIPLPQSEQDAIRALKTYYPTTVITVDGGEVDPNIEVTYTADTKNYIDQKIESINKAIVTTQKALL